MNKYKFYEEAGDDGAASDNASTTNDTQTNENTDTDTAGQQENYFNTTPDTWRTDLISQAGFEGDDAAKRLGQLERMPDLKTLTKSFFDAQDKIRKGEISSGLPENPTEEQLNEWRTANGVPVEPNYELTLGDGLELAPEDQEIFNEVFQSAHAGNVNTDTMNQMTTAYLKGRQALEEKMTAQDGIDSQQGKEVLKTAWKGDYETNLNMINGLFNQMPEAVRDEFLGSRMANGKGMMNSPEVLEFFAQISRKVNPAGTVVPNANNPVQAIDDEIKKLEERMGSPEWYKDQGAQKRYQDLITAKQNM